MGINMWWLRCWQGVDGEDVGRVYVGMSLCTSGERGCVSSE